MSNLSNSFLVNSFFLPISITPFSSNINMVLKLFYWLRGDTYVYTFVLESYLIF